MEKHLESPGVIKRLPFRKPETPRVAMLRQNVPDGRCLESRAISLMVNSKKTKVAVSNLKGLAEDNIASS